MFELIKLETLVDQHSTKVLSKLTRSGICYIFFKRSVLEKQFYNFVGYCIAARNRGIGSSFIVRNVVKSYPIEYTFSKYSPLIQSYYTRKNLHYTKRSKLYFLRKKKLPLSIIKFSYIN